MMHIQISNKPSQKHIRLILIHKKQDLKKIGLTQAEADYVGEKIKTDETYIIINRLSSHVVLQVVDEKKEQEYTLIESLRDTGAKIAATANAHKYEILELQAAQSGLEHFLLSVAEGCVLGNYQFLKYKTKQVKPHSLKEIHLIGESIHKKDLQHIQIVTEAVSKARDWVNEPQSYLNAVVFAQEIKSFCKKADIRVEVLQKKQIEALKMGGLLAVNKGSQLPPTFTILEWKPKKHVNKKPIVLVGKGVVYDTGGLSLKPTPNSMDTMKCDMAGAAAVAAATFAIAKAQLPVHVITLIPATDNRPGEQAYTPGDVIHMYDGQTVEVLNTDAEGRMLLADALAYAKKYKPELVLDFATLTGAAAAAIGPYGIVCMGNANEKTKDELKKSGQRVYERLVEFPFWSEYEKLIKSDLADMKNIGGPIGGAITAGKFLEKFTDYNWMHFDIAGPAFLSSSDSYRGKHGTGVGVRLLFDFIKQYSK